MNYLMLLISILLGVAGQIFMRRGMLLVKSNLENDNSLFTLMINGLLNFQVITGVACYAISLLIWLYVISDQKMGLSYARPLVGVGYILSALYGWVFMKESFHLGQFFGVLLIVAGAFLILFYTNDPS